MSTSSTTTDEPPEQRIFEIAARCRIPLRRLTGEPLASVADRLTLEIEQRVALMLLELQELATIEVGHDTSWEPT